MNQCNLQLFTSEVSNGALGNMRCNIINDLWQFLRCISLTSNLSKQILGGIIENINEGV
jgi:hypothetical protein